MAASVVWVVCIAVCVAVAVAGADGCHPVVYSDTPWDATSATLPVAGDTAQLVIVPSIGCQLVNVSSVTVNGVDVTASFTGVNAFYVLTSSPTDTAWPWEGLRVSVTAAVEASGLGDADVVVVTTSAVVAPGAAFEERMASSAGVAPTPFNSIFASIEDLDGDGAADVVLSDASEVRVFRNRHTPEQPLLFQDAAYPSVAAAVMKPADLDGDGLLDLQEFRWSTTVTPTRVMLNTGHPTQLDFVDVAGDLGVAGPEKVTTVCAADFDNDGDVDLFLGRSGNNAARRNQGTFFDDATTLWQLKPAGSAGDASRCVVFDADADGDVDLMVARNSEPVLLFVNQVADTDAVGFQELSDARGLAQPDAHNVTSLAVGDVNGDTHLDVLMCQRMFANKLMVNDGSGSFTAVGPAAGVGDTGPTVGCLLVDVDADGDPDIVGAQSNAVLLLLINVDAGNLFVNLRSQYGMELALVLRSAGTADLDLDGDLDFFLADSLNDRLLLSGNDATNVTMSKRVRVRVTDRHGGLTSAGATVTLSLSPGATLHGDLHWSTTRAVAVDNTQPYVLTLHVPDATLPYDLQVRWPGGAVGGPPDPALSALVPAHIDDVVHVPNKPRIVSAAVTSPVGAAVVAIGDTVELRLDAAMAEDGLTLHPSSTVNGVAMAERGVTAEAVGGGQYRLVYTIQLGDPDWLPGSLPVHVVLTDGTQPSPPVTQLAPHAVAGDSNPPEVALACGPPPATPNATVTLCPVCPTEAATGCVVSYVVDTGTGPSAVQVVSPPVFVDPARLTFGAYADGTPVVVVLWAADTHGNSGSPVAVATTVPWVVDQTPPQSRIESGPTAAFIPTDHADFVFGCSEPQCTFWYSLDDAPLAPLGGGGVAAGGATTRVGTVYTSGPPRLGRSPALPPMVFTGLLHGVSVAAAATAVVEVRLRITGGGDASGSGDWLPLPASDVTPAATADDPVAFTASYDVGAAVAAAGLNMTAPGTYALAVSARTRAPDGVVDTTPVVVVVVVDTLPPTLQVLLAPSGVVPPASNETLVVHADEDDCVFLWDLFAGPVDDDAPLSLVRRGSSPVGVLSVAGVEDEAQWMLAVSAQDAAGNTGAATMVRWTTSPCPATVPRLQVVAAEAVGDGSVFVEVVVVDDDPLAPWPAVELRVDSRHLPPDDGWDVQPDGRRFVVIPGGGLSGEAHAAELRATVPRGCNAQLAASRPEPAVFQWRQRASLPVVATFQSGPDLFTPSLFASFDVAVSRTPAWLECRLDHGADPLDAGWQPCDTPVVLGPLPSGVHELQVRAVALDGTAGPSAAYAWAIQSSADTTLTLSDLPDGRHTVAYTAVDAAGLREVSPPPPAVFTVDTVPPSTHVATPAGTFARTLTANVTCGNEAADVAPLCSYCWQVQPQPGTGTPQAAPDHGCAGVHTPLVLHAQADGLHTVEVAAQDPAGNADPSPVVASWTADTTPPNTTIHADRSPPTWMVAAGMNAVTNAAPLAVNASATEAVASFRVAVNGGAPRTVAAPPDTQRGTRVPLTVATALPDGRHVVHVAAVDVAGNVDPAPARTVLGLDTVPPSVEVSGVPPALPTSTLNATLVGHDAGGVNATGVSHFDAVLAHNAVGGGPASWAPHSAVRVAASDGARATVSFTGLATGVYRLRVAAGDYAGNVSPVQEAVTVVDFEPPVAVFAPPLPPATWPHRNLTVVAAAAEPCVFSAQVVPVRHDGTPAATGGQPWTVLSAVPAPTATVNLTALPDGVHVVSLSAVDAAGNVQQVPPANATVDVDATPPSVTLTEAPPSVTRAAAQTVCAALVDSSAVVTTQHVTPGSAANGVPLPADAVAFTAEVAEPAAHPTPATSLVQLLSTRVCVDVDVARDGVFTVEVAATDALGHAAQPPLVHTWIVDRSPPGVALPAGHSPAGLTPQCTPLGNATVCGTRNVPLHLACDDGDGVAGAVAPCDLRVAPALVTPADAGTCTPPAARRLLAAGGDVPDADALEFVRWEAGDDAAGNGGVGTLLLAPDGLHHVYARGQDAAGNTHNDVVLVAAVHVDTAAPRDAPLLVTTPPRQSPLQSALFRFGLPPGDTSPGQSVFVVSVDSGADTVVADVPSAGNDFQAVLEVTGLGVGTHTLRVAVRDQAGNTGPAAVYDWTVGTAAPRAVLLHGPAAVSGDAAPTVVVQAVWDDGAHPDRSGVEPEASVEVVVQLQGGDTPLVHTCADTLTAANHACNFTVPELVAQGTYLLSAQAAFGSVVGSQLTTSWQFKLCAKDQEFAVLSGNLAIDCRPCPAGATCPGGAATADRLIAKPGFWVSDAGAADASTPPTFHECFNPAACLAGTVSPNGTVVATARCAEGYTGTLCDVCEDGFFRQFQRCEACSSSPDELFMLVVVAVVLVAAVAAFVARFRHVLPKEQLKVAVSFAQVLAAASTSYSIPWPASFASVANSLQVFLVDVLAMTRVSCSQPMSYFASLVVLLLAFKAVCILLVAAPIAVHRLQRWRRRHQTGSAATMSLPPSPRATDGLSPPSATPRRPRTRPGMHAPPQRPQRRRRRSSFVASSMPSMDATARVFRTLFLFLVFAYPGVSLKIMKLFDCVEIDGRHYLVADMRLECYDARWFPYAVYGLVMGVLYIVGLPLTVSVILFRNRHNLLAPSTVARWGFLYETYGTRAYLWEVEELVRKLALSSLVVVMERGTPLQATSALMTSWIAHVLHSSYKPWKEGLCDVYYLQHFSLFLTTFVFLCGLLFQVDGVAQHSDTFTALASLLIALVLLFLVAVCAAVVRALRGKPGARAEVPAAMKAGGKAGGGTSGGGKLLPTAGDPTQPDFAPTAAVGRRSLPPGVTQPFALVVNPMFERTRSPTGSMAAASTAVAYRPSPVRALASRHLSHRLPPS